MTKVEKYLYEKLLNNRISLEQDQIDMVLRIYSNKDGWKNYIDRFVESLVNKQ